MKIIVAIDTGELKRVGTLYHEARGGRESSVFEYLDSWRSGGGFALCPSMPLHAPAHSSKSGGDGHVNSLPAPVADACPDAWGRRVVLAWARAAGTQPLSDVDFLLAGADATRWGALRFLNAAGEPLGDRDGAPAILSVERLAADVGQFERTGKIPEGLTRFVGAASSAGGARPKAVVEDGGKLFIAKFTSVHDENKAVERAEVLALHLARRAGIDASHARVAGAKDMPIALIERFDRVAGRRVHVVSAQSFLGAPQADGCDYADVVEQMRAHADEFAAQTRELYRRIAFNVLVRNTDDHLKNHAFAHIGAGRWRLTPCFDVNPQPERHSQLKTAINGRFDATVDNLFAGHTAFGIPLAEARGIVRDVAQTVVNDWRQCAKAVGLSGREVQFYAQAFEHEETGIQIP